METRAKDKGPDEEEHMQKLRLHLQCPLTGSCVLTMLQMTVDL